MATAAQITRFTPEQYLAMERKADFKSEYDGGFITAMAGTSRWHNLIAVNLSREIRSQFKNRPCQVYISDMRLCVDATGLYTYPDVMAVCGKPRVLGFRSRYAAQPHDDRRGTLAHDRIV